ncbi:uncharacterized protein LY89DRAFT_674283 [Mollisia scopiformis]|uniref:C2H2-type domain-containing protein n=1 Tax=Mollisia scopiformis TaxID=149040 RepID=A0A194WVM5_MOLSC|nr:uncharacterized protein LY89DRAFT_674283 [Mollisia scopiformis]KUJ11719.1 hypothetical protein LY89DRAFT_674283 [Mollisia scopiformis]
MASPDVLDMLGNPAQLDGFNGIEPERDRTTAAVRLGGHAGTWNRSIPGSNGYLGSFPRPHASLNSLGDPYIQMRPTPNFPTLVSSPERSNIDHPDRPLSPSAESLRHDIPFQARKCQHPGCKDQRLFTQPSAYKKHTDKHLRPFKCPVPTCTVNSFATPGDLKRHEREVHAAPAYIYPIISCKRHRRGFSRKDNLVQHLRRTHDLVLGDSAGSIQTELSVVSEEAFRGTESTDQVEDVISSPSEKTSLMTKLKELENEKVEAVKRFDGDILALKRILAIM